MCCIFARHPSFMHKVLPDSSPQTTWNVAEDESDSRYLKVLLLYLFSARACGFIQTQVGFCMCSCFPAYCQWPGEITEVQILPFSCFDGLIMKLTQWIRWCCSFCVKCISSEKHLTRLVMKTDLAGRNCPTGNQFNVSENHWSHRR